MKGQNNIRFGNTFGFKVADNVIVRDILLQPYFFILYIEMKNHQKNLHSIAPTNPKYLIMIIMLVKN